MTKSGTLVDKVSKYFFKRARILLGATVVAASLAYAQTPPGLPIEYWDSPSGCVTCDPSRGVFRDGLHALDGSSIELLMDCDGDGEKETDINSSGLNMTTNGGAYDVIAAEETASVCGYSTTNPDRQKGDVRLGGVDIAYPRNLLFSVSGDITQQRLDTYGLILDMPAADTLDLGAGIPEAISYDYRRGNINDLKAFGGLSGTPTVDIGLCNTPFTLIMGLPEVLEDPAPGEAFFYIVRPRSLTEVGNYGVKSDGLPRENPLVDCP